MRIFINKKEFTVSNTAKNNDEWIMISKQCEHCQREFDISPSRINIRKFCSRICKWESQKISMLNHHISDETRNKISSALKGKYPTNETRKKLSESHRGKRKPLSEITKKRIGYANQKKPFIVFNISLYNRLKNCEICGHGFRYSYKKANTRFCSFDCWKIYQSSVENRKKASEIRSGEKAPLWRGGISFEPYHYEFNNLLKEKIRDNFGRMCMHCGKSESENDKKLCVHHIDYDKKNCDESNLIPLCSTCHSLTNHNRDYWKNYFSMSIICKERRGMRYATRDR